MSVPSFDIAIQPERERVRVVPQGELDIVTVGLLASEISELRARGFKAIVLDTREVTFIDSSGLRLLLRLDAESRSDGFSFSIVVEDGPVRRVIRATGFDGHFRYADG